MSREARGFFIHGWEGECRNNISRFFGFACFCFRSYDMRHKYMTFVMLICVSVCFVWFCWGVFGVRKAFIWFGCVW